MNPEAIFTEACNAAQAESDASEQRQDSWFPCGFTSVIIRPARGKFITFLKSRNIGSLGYNGGWRISSYAFSSQSSEWCQSMNVKSDATGAAVRVLLDAGINAALETRMD